MGMSFKRALTATVLTAGLLAGNVVPAFAADAPATGTSQGGAAPVAADKKIIEVTGHWRTGISAVRSANMWASRQQTAKVNT